MKPGVPCAADDSVALYLDMPRHELARLVLYLIIEEMLRERLAEYLIAEPA